jgi:subtilisin family serine protease
MRSNEGLLMKLPITPRHHVVGFYASLSVLTASAAALPGEMAANDRALTQTGVYAAWARGYTGQGIRIGFVDTGADLTNKDLKNVVLSKSPYYSTMRDVSRGHGTQMISLAAAAKDGTGIVGVAYNSSVLAYAGGIGGLLFIPEVNNGIRWNADNRADVINLSLGMRESKAVFNASYQILGTGSYARLARVSDAYANMAMLPSLQYATG